MDNSFNEEMIRQVEDYVAELDSRPVVLPSGMEFDISVARKEDGRSTANLQLHLDDDYVAGEVPDMSDRIARALTLIPSSFLLGGRLLSYRLGSSWLLTKATPRSSAVMTPRVDENKLEAHLGDATPCTTAASDALGNSPNVGVEIRQENDVSCTDSDAAPLLSSLLLPIPPRFYTRSGAEDSQDETEHLSGLELPDFTSASPEQVLSERQTEYFSADEFEDVLSEEGHSLDRYNDDHVATQDLYNSQDSAVFSRGTGQDLHGAGAIHESLSDDEPIVTMAEAHVHQSTIYVDDPLQYLDDIVHFYIGEDEDEGGETLVLALPPKMYVIGECAGTRPTVEVKRPSFLKRMMTRIFTCGGCIASC